MLLKNIPLKAEYVSEDYTHQAIHPHTRKHKYKHTQTQTHTHTHTHTLTHTHGHRQTNNTNLIPTNEQTHAPTSPTHKYCQEDIQRLRKKRYYEVIIETS